MKKYILGIGVALSLLSCKPNNAQPAFQSHLSPDERFGALFEAVQSNKVFPDGKTFVDCTPKLPDAEIMALYESMKSKPGFDLAAFVKTNFEMPQNAGTDYKSNSKHTASEHITDLWNVLFREADAKGGHGSLIPLPHTYIVPGGRFREIYYWDSYFTMLGLQSDNRYDLIKNMVDNFAWMIDSIGHIPNGNRTYYLGRSQPPFFAMMVKVLTEGKGDAIMAKYLSPLEKEYSYWMAGADKLNAKAPSHRRVVLMPDGSILNRYYDDKSSPRSESWLEDVNTAKSVPNRPAADVYRDLRAGAESGWDFSSRWFKDGKNLSTIHTTEITPVDLNSLMFNLEMMIGFAAYQTDDGKAKGDLYFEKANKRRQAILKYCWNEQEGFFYDYDFVANKQTMIPTMAGAFPLFFKIAEPRMAELVSKRVERDFLKPGGVVSTLSNTGQQWDAPNGWAPLQWIAIKGLRNYGKMGLANQIKTNWVGVATKVYQNTGKMLEKYNVLDMSLEAGGGEYPVQDGFGWTNGVLQHLIKEEKYKGPSKLD